MRHRLIGELISRSHEFSWSVTAVGDLNGDGIPDLMIGAEIDASKNQHVGVLHVVNLQPNHNNPSFKNEKGNKSSNTKKNMKNIRGNAKSANVQSSWF